MLPWMNNPPTQGRGSIPINNLVGGMHKEKSANNLAPNEFTEIQNMIVTPYGLARQPIFEYAITESNELTPTKSVFAGIARSIARAFTSAGASIAVLFTSTKGYKLTDFTSTALTSIPWGCQYYFPAGVWASAPLTYSFPSSVHTITLSPTVNITFDGTAYSVDYSFIYDMFIKVGDVITFTQNVDLTGNTFTGTVLTITGTVMTLGSVTGTTSGTYRVMSFARVWSDQANSGEAQFLDTDYAQNTLVATGINLPLSKYDTGTDYLYRLVSIGEANGNDYYYPSNVTASSASNRLLAFSAATVHYFRDRLWVGYLKDKTGTYRNRIRWSNPLDPLDDWSDNTSYIDIPSSSEIVKITSLGEYLIVFCADSIFYGYTVSIPGLPLAFNSLNMQGVGLIGIRAVCSTGEGLFWVGQNDIYYMGGNLQPTAIGVPIVKQAMGSLLYPKMTQVIHDATNYRVLFGFFDDVNDPQIQYLWSFEYRAKAWSRLYKRTQFIGSYHVNNRNYLFATENFSSYLGNYLLTKQGSANQAIAYTSASSLLEHDEGSLTIITGDITLDNPDIVKDWFRLEITIEDLDLATTTRSYQIDIVCSIAMDESTTYTGIGTLSIYTGKKSGSIDFKAHGKTARFKLVFTHPTTTNTTNYVGSFTVNQYIMDVKAMAPYKAVK